MNRLGMMIDVSHNFWQVVFLMSLSLVKAPVIASHSSVRALANNNRNMTDEMIKKLAEKGGVIQICLLDDLRERTWYHNSKVSGDETSEEKYIVLPSTRWTKRRKRLLVRNGMKFSQKYQQICPTVKNLVDHIDHVKKPGWWLILLVLEVILTGGGGLLDCADVSQFPNVHTGTDPERLFRERNP